MQACAASMAAYNASFAPAASHGGCSGVRGGGSSCTATEPPRTAAPPLLQGGGASSWVLTAESAVQGRGRACRFLLAVWPRSDADCARPPVLPSAVPPGLTSGRGIAAGARVNGHPPQARSARLLVKLVPGQGHSAQRGAARQLCQGDDVRRATVLCRCSGRRGGGGWWRLGGCYTPSGRRIGAPARASTHLPQASGRPRGGASGPLAGHRARTRPCWDVTALQGAWRELARRLEEECAPPRPQCEHCCRRCRRTPCRAACACSRCRWPFPPAISSMVKSSSRLAPSLLPLPYSHGQGCRLPHHAAAAPPLPSLHRSPRAGVPKSGCSIGWHARCIDPLEL